MDLGLANGIYSNKLEGNANGIYDNINTGLHNGIYNENLITNGIIRDNLSLILDLSEFYCYPKSGTIIKDLYNRYSQSLINGVQFSFLNNGNLSFDGINDYISGSTYNPFGTTNSSYTYEIVFKVNSIPTLTSVGCLGASTDGTTSSPAFFLAISNTGFIQTYGHSASPQYFDVQKIQTNKIYHFICSRITNSIENNYINSNFINKRTITPSPNFTGFAWLGGTTNSFYINCNIYLVRIYTKALTQSEVNQNFLATKSRFNL